MTRLYQIPEAKAAAASARAPQAPPLMARHPAFAIAQEALVHIETHPQSALRLEANEAFVLDYGFSGVRQPLLPLRYACVTCGSAARVCRIRLYEAGLSPGGGVHRTHAFCGGSSLGAVGRVIRLVFSNDVHCQPHFSCASLHFCKWRF